MATTDTTLRHADLGLTDDDVLGMYRAMLMARGDVSVFVTRPISLGFILATALLLLLAAAPLLRRRTVELAG